MNARIWWLAAALPMVACVEQRNTELTPEIEAAAAANNAFSIDLYRQTAPDNENYIVSPFSVSAALAMTYAGAEGVTEEEMATVLHVGDDEAAYHEGYGTLMQELDGRYAGYEINLANRLFGQKGATWKEPFLEVTAEQYASPLEELDFGEAEHARKRINRWVDGQTSGYVDELLPSGSLVGAELVLVNAVYFEGDWAETFDKDQTAEGDFTRADGTDTVASFMNKTHEFGYAEADGAQIARLPYESDETSMIVVLADDLAALEESLTSEQVNGWMDSLSPTNLRIGLPKFTMNGGADLAETLADLGMPSAFGAEADLTGMSDAGLYIDFVIHEAYIEVDEQGTKAAAATAVGTKVTSTGPAPVEMICDHPFLFLLRDDITGTIMFMGHITDPSAS